VFGFMLRADDPVAVPMRRSLLLVEVTTRTAAVNPLSANFSPCYL